MTLQYRTCVMNIIDKAIDMIIKFKAMILQYSACVKNILIELYANDLCLLKNI